MAQLDGEEAVDGVGLVGELDLEALQHGEERRRLERLPVLGQAADRLVHALGRAPGAGLEAGRRGLLAEYPEVAVGDGDGEEAHLQKHAAFKIITK